MSQRVNIQYSVEVDNIQETVDYLYNKVLTRADLLYQNMSETSSYLDIELIESIDSLRRELSQIDIQLADVDKITRGYIGLRTAQQNNDQTTTLPEDIEQGDTESSSQSE